MTQQRFAKKANEIMQQIQQIAQAIYLDEQITVQQFNLLQQQHPLLAMDFHHFEQKTNTNVLQLMQIQQLAQMLQQELQKQFGPEPNFPVELATETYFIK
ncbi:hypothetical protein [Fictibacillus gelatini]|uniref:hypothetical protein n=1 Tax=Fictibacillus gelatini TaxID=225985 RepID=UPI0004082648|nr:hypothetical protein [Fictibacillus gelatini]